MVFVGGATVSLYADRRAIEVRATEDVDIVVEIATWYEYTQLEEQLEQWGFKMTQQPNLLVVIYFLE